jgi:mono/diheme cytochrome c family protein
VFVLQGENGPRHRLPFPFSELLKAIDRRVEPGPTSIRTVLIPLGRSLQRSAAAPDFFRFPRVVAAVTGNPREGPRTDAGMLLKDRLYIGYQEKAAVLEVISYNEAAARFEFQVVKDYRAGGTPHVTYARRAVCTACHQNGAPLFARPLWDETNANVQIAEKLAAHGYVTRRTAHVGVETPYAIDSATDRANLFAATQLLWQRGCGIDDGAAVRCRAAALQLALRFLLGGAQGVDVTGDAFARTLGPTLTAQSRRLWPAGLKVPNPDVPNRVPLAVSGDGDHSDAVAAPFEPLVPRLPIEMWAAGPDLAGRLVVGLAEFVSTADVRRLDARLHRADAPRSVHGTDCSVSDRREVQPPRIGFRCGSPGSVRLAGRLYLQGQRVTHGDLDQLAVDEGRDAVGLTVEGGELLRTGRHWHVNFRVKRGALAGRTVRGERVESIDLRWPAGTAQGSAEVVLRDDVAQLDQAVQRLSDPPENDRTGVFSSQPFQRARVLPALFDALGMPKRAWCCLDAAHMPAVALEDAGAPAPTQPVAGVSAGVRRLLQFCGACHRSADAFPPNWLHGDAHEIEARVKQCAPRIAFRLEMWRTEPAKRAKTPMPPVHALPMLGRSEAQWRDGDDLAQLRAAVRALGADAAAPVGDYEQLRPCLAGRGA